MNMFLFGNLGEVGRCAYVKADLDADDCGVGSLREKIWRVDKLCEPAVGQVSLVFDNGRAISWFAEPGSSMNLLREVSLELGTARYGGLEGLTVFAYLSGDGKVAALFPFRGCKESYLFRPRHIQDRANGIKVVYCSEYEVSE